MTPHEQLDFEKVVKIHLVPSLQPFGFQVIQSTEPSSHIIELHSDSLQLVVVFNWRECIPSYILIHTETKLEIESYFVEKFLGFKGQVIHTNVPIEEIAGKWLDQRAHWFAQNPQGLLTPEPAVLKLLKKQMRRETRAYNRGWGVPSWWPW